MKAVADTSSLIHPAKVPLFWKAMRETFEQIIIPQAVLDEILKGKHLGSPDVPEIEKAIDDGWIKVVKSKKVIRNPPLSDNLGEGEKECISLAMQEAGRKIDWLLMDDEIAAKTARSMGLPVRSTSYLPIYWAKKGDVKASKVLEMLDDLVRVGYRLGTKDYVAIKDIILGID